MATAKKSTKRTTRAKSTAKRPAAKAASARTKSTKPVRAASKPRTTTVRRKSAAKSAEMQSFHLAEPDQDFLSFRPSIQTLYWSILALAIFSLGLWVLDLNLQVQELYNELDRVNLDGDSYVAPKTPPAEQPVS
ncbi:hypothetical protein CR983_02920 [Candidatus Saccharibacteria bacterium]|nr:MAG: hypothetical protein CR983_02920 [Candidatus Saccharibacteria bacterium]